MIVTRIRFNKRYSYKQVIKDGNISLSASADPQTHDVKSYEVGCRNPDATDHYRLDMNLDEAKQLYENLKKYADNDWKLK